MVRLIHDGQLRLDKIEDHSEEELRTMLDQCGASITPDIPKVVCACVRACVCVCVRVCVCVCACVCEREKQIREEKTVAVGSSCSHIAHDWKQTRLL